MNKSLIYWSPLAEYTYLELLTQIIERWSVKEAEAFELKVENLVEKLKIQNQLCPESEKQTNLRRCVVTNQTSLIYQIKGQVIELVAFVDNRSNHIY